MRKEDIEVGSVLTVRKDLKVRNIYGVYDFVERMNFMLGKKVTVTHCYQDCFRVVENDCIFWTWEMMEESQESQPLPVPKKSMLKDGDYVVDKEVKFIVSLSFGKIFNGCGEYNGLSGYDEYLNTQNVNRLPILEIWRDGILIAKRTVKNDRGN